MNGLHLFQPVINPLEVMLPRTFSLADDVDESKAVAKYSDGVLSLELPKKATSSSGTKRITIQ